jgi:selenophosphate synthetase-related protein
MDFYDWLSFPLSWKYAVNKHNKEFNFLKNTMLYLTEVLVKNSKQISYGKNTVGTDYEIMFQ